MCAPNVCLSLRSDCADVLGSTAYLRDFVYSIYDARQQHIEIGGHMAKQPISIFTPGI